jgi:hypothetical protein
MARYLASNQLGGTEQNLATTYKTLLRVTALTGATTLRRGWIDEVIVGADGAAVSTDCQIVFAAQKQTAAGTDTAITPVVVESTDAAALLVYAANATAEGTITANTDVLDVPVNQRQSQRVAYPDFRLSPMVIPAVTTNGIAIRAKSTNYTSTAVCYAGVIE